MKNATENQNYKKHRIRKPYNKPLLLRVNLVAGEAVLNVGCKTTSGGLLNGQNQFLACFNDEPCNLAGS